MKPTTVTTLFFLVWLAAPFAYNAFAAAVQWKGASISEVVTAWGRDYPILIVALCLLIGAVLGHWAWPIRPD